MAQGFVPGLLSSTSSLLPGVVAERCRASLRHVCEVMAAARFKVKRTRLTASFAALCTGGDAARSCNATCAPHNSGDPQTFGEQEKAINSNGRLRLPRGSAATQLQAHSRPGPLLCCH